MAIDKIQSESINLADTFAFTGTVTGAGENNKPIFKVSGSSLSLSHNTWTKLTISSEAIDTGGCFDLGVNNRFTPNVAGKYLFILSIMSPTGTDVDYIGASIYKNGSSAGGANGQNLNYNSTVFSTILEANGSSDYFEAYAEQESGGSLNIQVSEFSGFYIGN